MKQINKRPSKLLLKKGDKVEVIAGKDKGTVGEILKVDRTKQRVVVRGVNIVTKHVKPTQNQEGHIDRFEAPIHYSNVLLYCEQSQRGERIRIEIDSKGEKTRFFVKSKIPVA